jgi:hypothetical protein
MRASSWLGACIVSCLVCACGDDTSRIELLPYLDYCVGETVGPCMRSVDGDVYDGIQGFQFEWGYRMVLAIRTLHIDHPPADSSSIRYDLVDVESRTPVEKGTRFDPLLRPPLEPEQFARIVTGDCTAGFELFPRTFQRKQFSFEASDTCASLERLIAVQVPSKLSFEFDIPDKPLKLVTFE